MKSSWWHRYLAGAARRLEACTIKGGGHGGRPHWTFHDFRVGRKAHTRRLVIAERMLLGQV